MKYVIIKATLADIPRVFSFAFNERWTHADFAECMQRMIQLERTGSERNWVRTYKDVEIFSAGFCFIRDNMYQVTDHGSESLRIAKDNSLAERDEKILNMLDALQGMML